jgi:hypothetical protein
MESSDISQLVTVESETLAVSDETAENVLDEQRIANAATTDTQIPPSNENDIENIESIGATKLTVETEFGDKQTSSSTELLHIGVESNENHDITEDLSCTENNETTTEPATFNSMVSEVASSDLTPTKEEQKKPLDKKEKLESLRYGEKGRPAQTTPKAVHKPDADLLKMMKQSSTKLKSFDYSKLKGKKKDLTVATEVLPSPSESASPGKLVMPSPPDIISRVDSQENRLSPKKLSSFARDGWKPPGGHYYGYEDLVAANISKDYGDLQENHLEAYLQSTDFENVFGMNRKMFYDLPDWRQHQLKREKRLF